jgi:hypothetical protein
MTDHPWVRGRPRLPLWGYDQERPWRLSDRVRELSDSGVVK